AADPVLGVALVSVRHRAGARAREHGTRPVSAYDRVPERGPGEHVDRVLRAPAGEVDPIHVPEGLGPAALAGVVTPQDHNRDDVGAERREMRLPELGPALRRVLEAGCGRDDRDARAW